MFNPATHSHKPRSRRNRSAARAVRSSGGPATSGASVAAPGPSGSGAGKAAGGGWGEALPVPPERPRLRPCCRMYSARASGPPGPGRAAATQSAMASVRPSRFGRARAAAPCLRRRPLPLREQILQGASRYRRHRRGLFCSGGPERKGTILEEPSLRTRTLPARYAHNGCGVSGGRARVRLSALRPSRNPGRGNAWCQRSCGPSAPLQGLSPTPRRRPVCGGQALSAKDTAQQCGRALGDLAPPLQHGQRAIHMIARASTRRAALS